MPLQTNSTFLLAFPALRHNHRGGTGMAELAKTFGRRVRALRQERGFSQADLAERIGASEEWIRRMERGDGAPSFRTLEALSTALAASVGEMFAEPTTDAERFAAAVEGLNPDALRWLMNGARLLRDGRTPPVG